jgi:hypothetical protein
MSHRLLAFSFSQIFFVSCSKLKTTYPTVPFPNVFWMTEKTYANQSVFAVGNSQLEPTIQQFLGDKLLTDTFYEGLCAAARFVPPSTDRKCLFALPLPRLQVKFECTGTPLQA